MSGSTWPQATLLNRLRAPVRNTITAAGTLVRFPANKAIIRQGDRSRHVLLLLDGFVKILASTEDGYEALLGIRLGGDLVGEMAAIDGQPRSATVVTCGVVPARFIRQTELKEIVGQYPELQSEITRTVSERLRWANRRRIDFRAHDAPTRVGRILVELAERYGRARGDARDLGVRLTQSELASLAGVALPTVEKALQALDRRGIVERQHRELIITDLAQLRVVTKMTPENPY